ncbi:SGNH family lipase [Allokutzneria multivorans]|uniref:SGNH family lipase n=1 Tax=Allokutzneria multivorans TaxID=1142134 RepID=A0ABP7U046_9PSEU
MRSFMVAVCVLSLLSAPESAAAQPAPTRTWLVLGDSYSSGEGVQNTATPSEHQPPESGERVRDCRRADGTEGNASSWAPTAYRMVAAELRVSRMDFLACTGAISDEIPGQIAEARKRFGVDKWDIVTFSVGGNNIRFADIIKDCIGIRLTWRAFVDQPVGCKITTDQLRARVDVLAGRAGITQDQYRGETTLPQIYKKVAEHVKPGGHVIVLGYPNIIEDTAEWPLMSIPPWLVKVRKFSCGLFLRNDVPLLRAGATYLNQRIQDVVREADLKHEDAGIRFDFLDISQKPYEDPSTGRHSICTDDPWLHGVKIDGEVPDLYFKKSFHPNQSGYDATGKVLADHLRARLKADEVVRSCPLVGFTPNSDDSAFEISSAGVPCDEVESMLREARRTTGFSNSFRVNGFDCRVTGVNTEGMITRIFRCGKDRSWFTFHRE